jgi:hypothetical protein
MESTELLIQIKNDVDDIKKLILQSSFAYQVSDKWLPRAKEMEFLNYGDTQMAVFEKSGKIEISRIGRRVFINRDSLTRLLNNHAAKK